MTDRDEEVRAQKARALTKFITDPWNMSSAAQRMEAALSELDPILEEIYDWLNQELEALIADRINPRLDADFRSVYDAFMAQVQIRMIYDSVFSVACAELGIAPDRLQIERPGTKPGGQPLVN